MIVATNGPSRAQLLRAMGTGQNVTFGEGSLAVIGTVTLLYDATHCDLPVGFATDNDQVTWVVAGSKPVKVYSDDPDDEREPYEDNVSYIAIVYLTNNGAFRLAMLTYESSPDTAEAFFAPMLLQAFARVASAQIANNRA